jgi:hypothetical protein
MTPTRQPSSLNRALRLAACGAVMVAASAHADPGPALDRVSLSLGGFYANTDINLSAQSNQIPESGHLKLADDKVTLPRARLDLLLGDSQGLEFDYFSFRRTRNATLDQPFNFDGNDFDLAAQLRGRVELDMGSAAYRWWLGSENDVFGIGLGAGYYRLKVGVTGSASVGGQSATASAGYDDDAVAPLVTLGWRHAFSDSLRLYADASGVKKNGGNLSGHIVNGALGVEWFPWRNIGISGEYAVTRIKLDHGNDNYQANLDVKLDGPAAYLRMRF